MIQPMRAWRRSSGAQRIAVLVLLLLVVLWLPGTLASDVRGLRSALGHSARTRAETTGPGARAGADLALLRLARATIPAGAPYAVLTTRRWREQHSATAREGGGSWTQFALAPRVQVTRRAARWLLVMDSSPQAAGVARPAHAWRTGRDWLVQTR
jgi:hypothetical protein